MKENGFYKIKPEFFDLVNRLGGRYSDRKQRPVLCCMQDAYIPYLYWAIPTSNLAHRSQNQIDKIKKWCHEPGIRSCYYHLGHTDRPALFKVSNCFPVTEKYIDGEYISQGKHLVLRDKREIKAIRGKLARILFDESIHPDKYEQHITSIRNYLIEEMKTFQKERTPYNDLLVSLHRAKGKNKEKNNDPER